MYERGAALSEYDAQRFIRKLIIEGYLRETLVEMAHFNVIAVLQLSNKGREFINNPNRSKVLLFIHISN